MHNAQLASESWRHRHPRGQPEGWLRALPVRSFCLAAAAAVALTYPAHADDPVPKGFSAQRYAQLWQRNPFTLVTPAAPQVAPSAFDKLALLSWFQAGSNTVVFVQHAETNEVQKITTKPNVQGLRLVEIHPSSNAQAVEAIITNGNEKGAVRFRMDAQNPGGAPGSAPNMTGLPNTLGPNAGGQQGGVPNMPAPQPGWNPNSQPHNAGAATNQVLNGVPPAQGRLSPGNYPRMPNAADFRRRRVLPAPSYSPPQAPPSTPPQGGPNSPGRENQD